MSRPLNKIQLLAAIQKEYNVLDKLLSTLTPDQMAITTAPGVWAIKDILAHLYEWQQGVSEFRHRCALCLGA